MIFDCNYWLMSSSAIITESFFFNRREHRPTDGQFVKSKRLWNTQSKMGCLCQTTSLRAQGTMQKRSVEARGDGCHQGNSILQTQKYCLTCYPKSTVAASTGQSQVQVDRIPVWTDGTLEVVLNGQPLAMEKLVFF